ncbi:MAG: GGDEF domain-containing protein [Candidatus Zixiibacteriota bacterium]
MDISASHIVLSLLVLILAVLLLVRQRQLGQLRPLDDIELVLKGLRTNLLLSRTEGKIQKVAGQLSNILITNLRSEHILFFRRQKRYLEMNYVYGMKNVSRSKYRIPVTDVLLQKLTDGAPIRTPKELGDLIGKDLQALLQENSFNLVFPIFWKDNLFGVYFIFTKLAINHPVVQAFLLFLNQNLSIAYQLTKMESTQRLLERRFNRELSKNGQNRDEDKVSAQGPEDPGHLIDVFSKHTVDDLMMSLFGKIKAGLKAEKLVFLSEAKQAGNKANAFSPEKDTEQFTLESAEFNKIFGSLQRNKIYDVKQLSDSVDADDICQRLKGAQFCRISRFSLNDKQKGMLLWTGKTTQDVEQKILSRLEHVGQRAMVNAVEFEKVQAMSYTDSLTGLYNYRYFIKRLNEEIQRASRYNRRVGLLLFDIDDFKVYNDNFGHQWGDELLRKMGRILAENLRSIDIVARYGGDEFCIIMPEADRATCSVFMDRLRHAIGKSDFGDTGRAIMGKITISIGAAIFPDDAENAERLIYYSDMALLKSKASGRNCNTLFSSDLLQQNKR